MLGIGRECGMASATPSWSRRRSIPASTRASFEEGGVLISPCSHTRGFRATPMTTVYVGYDISSRRLIFHKILSYQTVSANRREGSEYAAIRTHRLPQRPLPPPKRSASHPARRRL